MNSLTPLMITELQQAFPDIVALDVNMAGLSHWRIGGKLAALITPRNEQEIIQVRRWLHTRSLPQLILGNTTNLLFTNAPINAIGVKINTGFNRIEIEKNELRAQAGIYVPCLARKAMQHGLTGLEHTCGIPATLGGLVVMNGGSQRKGIGEVITYVKTITQAGEVKKYQTKDCAFSYRTSIFQLNNELVIEVGLKLKAAKEKRQQHNEMLNILRERSRKFPRKKPNCGSVFVSDPEMYQQYGPPGRIIESCRLKGFKRGGARVSTAHANFIVNDGGATAESVLDLIWLIRSRVFTETGYFMRVEAKFVDSAGKIKGI